MTFDPTAENDTHIIIRYNGATYAAYYIQREGKRGVGDVFRWGPVPDEGIGWSEPYDEDALAVQDYVEALINPPQPEPPPPPPPEVIGTMQNLFAPHPDEPEGFHDDYDYAMDNAHRYPMVHVKFEETP